MSYNKTIWTSGDTITAEKLNNVENGIAGASGGVGLVDQTDYYDLTVSYNDLLEMLDNGVLPFVVQNGEADGTTFSIPITLSAIGEEGGQYFANFEGLDPFMANSPDIPLSGFVK